MIKKAAVTAKYDALIVCSKRTHGTCWNLKVD
jgi:hypothetical protein